MILLGEVALGGAGCGFQPLYGSGSTTASGARLAETMASVDVQPIPGRVGQKVRSELIFENTGGGYVAETRYKLKIGLRQSVIDQLVQITGDTREQGLVLEATFKLISAADGQVIYEGSAVSRQRIFNTYQFFTVYSPRGRSTWPLHIHAENLSETVDRHLQSMATRETSPRRVTHPANCPDTKSRHEPADRVIIKS